MDKQTTLTLAGDLQQWGGTRLVELADGPERGVRAVEFRTTAGLELAALVDRGMDIAWARYRGRSIAWHSPTGFVHAAYRDPDRLGWLRTFGGGLFTSAGLDHILFPEEDPHDTYGYPARTSTTYGLHGRLSTLAGSLRGYGEEWRGETCVLFAEGEVRQAGALAENLVLRRRVETTLDGRSIAWTDTVENEGRQPTAHMLLYHINLGAPLLHTSCRLVLPSCGIRWATDDAAATADEHLSFPPPRRDFAEQAFEHDMAADAEERVEVALINHADPERPWGISLRYERARFPYFFQWRYFSEGTYALGFEPATNGATGRAEARRTGELTILQPGESRTARTEIAILDGAAECGAAAARIKSCVGGLA